MATSTRIAVLAATAVLGVVAAIPLAEPREASGQTRGASKEFFGVNAPWLRAFVNPPEAAALEGIATSMGEQRIDWARITFDQAVDNRLPGQFNWYATDTMVAALARHGVRAAGMFVGTAIWATDPALQGAYGPRAWPHDVEGWSTWVAAAARRYGSGGSFWAAHPGLPALPIRRWEIGNEVNSAIFWRPAASPEQYAAVYRASLEAIEAADPAAEAIVGGLAPRFGAQAAGDLDAPSFLKRLVAADPSLATRIPSVAVHPYASSAGGVLGVIAQFRAAMTAAGMPSVPILANEFGWYTQGEAGALKTTESRRAEMLAEVASKAWRTNCGVEGIAPYSWITLQQDPAYFEHWFGLTDARTGQPLPSGLAYGEQIRIARGLAATPPPQDTVGACPTAPAPSPGTGAAPGATGGQAASAPSADGAAPEQCRKGYARKRGKCLRRQKQRRRRA